MKRFLELWAAGIIFYLHLMFLPVFLLLACSLSFVCLSLFFSRCFAALGDASTVRFLHQTNQIADKVSQEMVCFISAQIQDATAHLHTDYLYNRGKTFEGGTHIFGLSVLITTILHWHSKAFWDILTQQNLNNSIFALKFFASHGGNAFRPNSPLHSTFIWFLFPEYQQFLYSLQKEKA